MKENINSIEVLIEQQKVGELFFEQEKDQYAFNYTVNSTPISLIMPYRKSTYFWAHKLHPIFDMNIPEGYLFEIFKNLLSKEYGYINDFLIFSYLCANIQSRLSYTSTIKKNKFGSIDIKMVLENDNEDTFIKVLNTFLNKNSISGVQPKTFALLEDKALLTTKEYIIKTWGNEYPELALNEYFCLKAVEQAGVPIANILLSKNNKFLLVERFNYKKSTHQYLGFEEILVLHGKNRDEKYSGSYESIAKTLFAVTTNKTLSMKYFYKTIIMNYLLKNGDAHLKNFAILYDKDINKIYYSPAYDIVNTCVYIYQDRPALTLFGKKCWAGKKELIKFGMLHCFFSRTECSQYYAECFCALKESITRLKQYIKQNKNFADIGSKMITTWELSLKETQYKELPVEIIRAWNKDKKSPQR